MTRLHRLAELCGDDARDLDAVAHYVADSSLFDILRRADVAASLDAIVAADLNHLPHASLLIEFEPSAGTSRFVRLQEAGQGFAAMTGALYRGTMARIAARPTTATIAGGRVVIGDTADTADAEAIALGVAVALLSLNTRGIDKEVIDSERLNRKRTASGKPPVPRYTIWRIGTVYDRNGNAVRDPEARKPARCHLRAGHTKMQFYGPGRALRKPIYIAPTIVNYCPGESDAPVARKLVRA